MAKPSSLPEWNSGGANNTEPNGAKKILGWVVNEAPPSSTFNWWQKLVWEWCVWLDGLQDEALTWTAVQTFEETIVAEKGLTATGDGLGNPAVTATNDNGTAVKGTSVDIGVEGEGAASTAAIGVQGTGGSVNGTGVKGLGGGTTGLGGYFEGGSASGTGAQVKGGGTTGVGLSATGGSASGAAVDAASGTGNTNVDVIKSRGYVDLSAASNPLKDDAVPNRLTPKSIVKVWAHFTLVTGSAPTVNEGLNLHSTPMTNTAGLYRLTFKNSFANANYVISPTEPAWGSVAGGSWMRIRVQAYNVAYVEFEIYNDTDVTTLDQAPFNGKKFGIMIVGAQ